MDNPKQYSIIKRSPEIPLSPPSTAVNSWISMKIAFKLLHFPHSKNSQRKNNAKTHFLLFLHLEKYFFEEREAVKENYLIEFDYFKNKYIANFVFISIIFVVFRLSVKIPVTLLMIFQFSLVFLEYTLKNNMKYFCMYDVFVYLYFEKLPGAIHI